MNRDEILESLNWRYAVKEFDSSKQIPSEDMDVLLDSLRLTASSFGLQLWEFVWVKNQELKKQLMAKSWNQKQVVDCSELLVLCIKAEPKESYIDDHVKEMVKIQGVTAESLAGFKKMVMGFIQNKGPEQADIWMRNQVYIALGSLLTTAALLKIDACPMEGFLKKSYDEILNLNEIGLKSALVCPLGYRASTDKYATIPKVRFPRERVIRVIE